MFIDKAYKVHLVASPRKVAGKRNTGIDYCKIEPDGHIVATNGKILARVPVILFEDDVPPEGVFIRPGDVKAILGKQCRIVGLSVQVEGGPTYPLHSLGDVGGFPDWRKVVPKIRATDLTDKVDAMGISPWLLRDLAEAMGATKKNPTVCLILGGKRGLVSVRFPGSPGALGAIMPRTGPDLGRARYEENPE